VTTRVISFAGSSVRIEYDGPDAADVVDFAFQDLPPAEGPPPHVTLRIQTDPGRSPHALYCGEALQIETSSLGVLARALLEQAAYHLSDRSQGGLLLHAAAVSRGEQCVLLPAPTGAGKTTLTAWLLHQEFGYLTDELVYVPRGFLDVVPFSRPLNVRAPTLQALKTSGLDFAAPAFETLNGPAITLVRPVLHVGPPIARLSLIVFPRYERDTAFRAERLSSAQAGLALIGCLVNARNLPGHGFAEVTRVVRETRACRVQYSNCESVSDWMAGVLDSSPSNG
jgi:hypothetical protein